MRELYRWRFLLGRHVKSLCGFSGQRACDRRLRALALAGYVSKKKYLYGFPSLYQITRAGIRLIGKSSPVDSIRLEHIAHDITLLDVLIYIKELYQLPGTAILSEKELHIRDGFANRKHQPDFSFTHGEKTYAVEVELSLKSRSRIEENVKINFLDYDYQLWFVEKPNKISRILGDFTSRYEGLSILYLEEVLKE